MPAMPTLYPATPEKTEFCSRRSFKVGYENVRKDLGFFVSWEKTWTSSWGLAYPGGANSIVWTRLKTAVLAPIPRVRTSTAAMVNPGAFQSCRTANRRSCIILPVRCGEELRRIQILSPFNSEPRADRDSKSVSVAARLRSFPEMGKTRIRQAARKRGA